MIKLWATLDGRPAIERRGGFYLLQIQKVGQRWPDTIGIFGSRDAAQAEIDARVAWKKQLRETWRTTYET